MSKAPKKPQNGLAKKQKFPPGWNEKRIRKVIAHYEQQTEDEAVAEDEAAYESQGQTVMIVPTELVPQIRQMLGRRRGA
jgi:hypothetical protein